MWSSDKVDFSHITMVNPEILITKETLGEDFEKTLRKIKKGKQTEELFQQPVKEIGANPCEFWVMPLFVVAGVVLPGLRPSEYHFDDGSG